MYSPITSTEDALPLRVLTCSNLYKLDEPLSPLYMLQAMINIGLIYLLVSWNVKGVMLFFPAILILLQNASLILNCLLHCHYLFILVL